MDAVVWTLRLRLVCCLLAGIGFGFALSALAHHPYLPPFWLTIGFTLTGAAGYVFFTARLRRLEKTPKVEALVGAARLPEAALVLLCTVALAALVDLFASLLFGTWSVAASIVTMGIAFVAASWVWLRRSKRPSRRLGVDDDEGGAEILAVLIVVGVAVLLVAVATGPLRACPACEASAAPSTPGARWTNCELARSETMPSCADLQPGEVLVTRDGAPVCVLKIVTTASAGSSVVRNVEVLACEAVTIASGG